MQHDQENGGFPPTKENKIIDWREFKTTFANKDPDATKCLTSIVDQYPDDLIDLRPYMWENPITAHAHDSLSKCLELFRVNHLRHLPVVNPANGECIGVITRKDLFAFMSL